MLGTGFWGGGGVGEKHNTHNEFRLIKYVLILNEILLPQMILLTFPVMPLHSIPLSGTFSKSDRSLIGRFLHSLDIGNNNIIIIGKEKKNSGRI